MGAGLAMAAAACRSTPARTGPPSEQPRQSGAATVSVSGYTVSNLSYTYDSSNPDNITKVEFELDNGAAVVHLQLASGGAWYGCSENAGFTASATPPHTVWDCDTTSPQATVTSQDEIRVVAHG